MNKENIKKMSSLLQNNALNNDKYQLIKIDDIEIDNNQPRKEFDENSINELAQSIKQYGVLTPISVSKSNNNKYILRHGERRYRASIIAGIDKIPAIIDNDYNEHTLIKQLIENIQRESLNNDEIANAINYLHNIEKMSLTEIAKALGKSNAYVSNFHSYAMMNIPLKNLVIQKTSDIIVISELNRIYKRITKEKSSLNDMLLDSFTKFVEVNKTLNRESVENLKNTLNYIENQYNLRQEKKEIMDIDETEELNKYDDEKEENYNTEENDKIEEYLDDNKVNIENNLNEKTDKNQILEWPLKK